MRQHCLKDIRFPLVSIGLRIPLEKFGCDIPRNSGLFRPFLSETDTGILLESDEAHNPDPEEDLVKEASETEIEVLEDMEFEGLESDEDLGKLLKTVKLQTMILMTYVT